MKKYFPILIIYILSLSINICHADEHPKTWVANFQNKSKTLLQVSYHSEYSNALKVINEISNKGYAMDAFSAVDYNGVNDLNNYRIYIKILCSGKYRDGTGYSDSIGTYTTSISEGLEFADAHLIKLQKEAENFPKPLDFVAIDCVKISLVCSLVSG